MAKTKKIVLNSIRCKGCGLCLDLCKKKLLSLAVETNASGYYPVQLSSREECNGCGLCALMCPDVALIIEEG